MAGGAVRLRNLDTKGGGQKKNISIRDDDVQNDAESQLAGVQNKRIHTGGADAGATAAGGGEKKETELLRTHDQSGQVASIHMPGICGRKKGTGKTEKTMGGRRGRMDGDDDGGLCEEREEQGAMEEDDVVDSGLRSAAMRMVTTTTIIRPNACRCIIPIPIVLLQPKTITIMQHNYISDKLGNNGKPKRDADPANKGPLSIIIRNRSTWLPCKNSKSLC